MLKISKSINVDYQLVAKPSRTIEIEIRNKKAFQIYSLKGLLSFIRIEIRFIFLFIMFNTTNSSCFHKRNLMRQTTTTATSICKKVDHMIED